MVPSDLLKRDRPRVTRRRALALSGAAPLLAACRSGSAAPVATSTATPGPQVAGVQALPPAAALPDAAAAGYKQAYPLSCEIAALHTALRLLGMDVSEATMRPLLPENEDPDVGFRGDMDANQTLDDYGVHAKGLLALVEALKAKGIVPSTVTGRVVHSVDEMHAAVAQQQPVIAWIPLQLMAAQRVAVTLSTGKVVHLVEHEHAVTLTGYDPGHVMALDPYDGSAPTYDVSAFASATALFDDPGLVVAKAA